MTDDKLTVDGSGRAQRSDDDDADALDIEQQQQDGAQESNPQPVGSWDTDPGGDQASGSEAGNGGDDAGNPQG